MTTYFTADEAARELDISRATLYAYVSRGLIRSEKVGRVRTCRVEPAAMRTAEGWLAVQRAWWEGRLDRLEAYLEDLQRKETGHAPDH